MGKVFLGKTYTWSGTDYTSANGNWRFLTKGTGDTIKDNGETAPVTSTKADWILSDDLGDLDVTRCMIRVKALKTAGTGSTALHTAFDCYALGLIDENEFGKSNNGNGEGVSVYISTQDGIWGSGSKSISNTTSIVTHLQLDSAAVDTGYCYFRFAADPTSGIITPFQFVACAFPIKTSASISGHTYQFEAQWVYS